MLKLSDGSFGFWRPRDRKSTRLNSSHLGISYAVFCLKKNSWLPACYRRISWWFHAFPASAESGGCSQAHRCERVPDRNRSKPSSFQGHLFFFKRGGPPRIPPFPPSRPPPD